MKKQKHISVKWRVISVSLTCLIALFVICFMTRGSKAEESATTAITHGFATNNAIPSEQGEKGTATNPVVILEMVPDMKLATIGYLIKGCEPVDVDKMVQDAKNGDSTADQYLYTICRPGVATHARNVAYEHKNAFLKNIMHVPDSKIADYHVVVKTITPGELNTNSQWVDRADLVFITNKAYDASIFNVYKNKKYIKFSYNNEVTNTNPINFSNKNDLTWDTVMQLFRKIVINEDRAGVIIDQSVFAEMYNKGASDGSLKSQVTAKQIGLNGKVISSSNPAKDGSNNNVFKLCLMLNTMNPQAFYNMFLYDYPDGSRKAAIINKQIDGRTTGVFEAQETTDAKVYWNVNTFMPPKLDGSPSNSTDWSTGECYKTYETKDSLANSFASVNSSVYVFQSDMSILDDLANTGKVSNNKLTKELFGYLEKETGTAPGSTSPAKAIRFIMGLEKNTNSQKESINILDLEPCAVSDKYLSKKGYLTELSFRFFICPTYVGKVNIVHQSSQEFIGKIEDLNSTYDMIYMGLYFGRLNIGSNGWPVYNDGNLQNKIYLHVGDQVTSRQENEYNVNWPTNMDSVARGPGNDITKLKQDKLKDYLRAGLPIVVDVDLYQQNTTYIDQTSYIYKMFNNKTEYSNLLSSSNPELGGKVATYFNKSGLILHVDRYPKEYEGNSTDGTINDSEYTNQTLSYGFYLEDSEYTSGMTYTAKLYVDISRDGHFSSDEIVQSRDNLRADKTYYTLSKTLNNNFVGAIPWKLVVSKDSNTAIRDMKEGFSAIKRSLSEKKEINVLQITDRDGSTLNLEQNVKNNGLFKKYTANLNDYTINFTTIDNVTFAGWYTASSRFNKYASVEEKATKDKLSKYNMIIFGFSDYYGNISNQYGALDNVIYYINSGKSVLMTHDVTSLYNVATPDMQNSYYIKGYNFNLLFRGFLGMDRFGARTSSANDTPTAPDGTIYKQKHGYTYQALARLAKEGQKSIYPECGVYQLPVFTHKASKLNGGQITRYPYQISNNLDIAETHSQYYQLDMENEDIVVWYTLDQDPNSTYNQFACSANDASNNYYIYSKGNITYSGVGHKDISNMDMEVRLFVNTIIAAYANGNNPPSVEVVNTGVYSTADNDYSMYVTVDYAETMFSQERYEDVSFVPRNNSLISEDIYVKAATADGKVMDVYNDVGVLISPDSKGYVKLRDGNTYHLKWPQEYLAYPEKKDITFICYYTEREKTRYGAATAHLLRRNLFDLD